MTQKDWNKLKAYAIAIVNDEDYANDLVQDFLIKMLENGKGDLNINSGYTFKGLRLLFLEEIYIKNADFRKRFSDEYKHFKQMEEDAEEDETIILQKDKQTQLKIDAATQVYDQLNVFDKQLYVVHYIKGISQRQISRETGIKLGTVQYRFKLIKQKITELLKK